MTGPLNQQRPADDDLKPRCRRLDRPATSVKSPITVRAKLPWNNIHPRYVRGGHSRAGPRREFQSPVRGRGLHRATNVKTPITVRARLACGRYAPLYERPLCPRRPSYTTGCEVGKACIVPCVSAPRPRPGWKLAGGFGCRHVWSAPRLQRVSFRDVQGGFGCRHVWSAPRLQRVSFRDVQGGFGCRHVSGL